MKIYRKIQSIAMRLYGEAFTKKLKRKVKNTSPTIFCNTCIGGYIYHRLGIEFLSPTINMWFVCDDMLNFLVKPDEYLSSELILISEENGHPVCKLKDIVLHFNHSDSFESARLEWERRKHRVDLNNSFAIIVDMKNEIAIDDKRLELISLKYKNTVVLNTKTNNHLFKMIKITHNDEWHYNFFGLHDWEKQWNFVKFLNCK